MEVVSLSNLTDDERSELAGNVVLYGRGYLVQTGSDDSSLDYEPTDTEYESVHDYPVAKEVVALARRIRENEELKIDSNKGINELIATIHALDLAAFIKMNTIGVGKSDPYSSHTRREIYATVGLMHKILNSAKEEGIEIEYTDELLTIPYPDPSQEIEAGPFKEAMSREKLERLNEDYQATYDEIEEAVMNGADMNLMEDFDSVTWRKVQDRLAELDAEAKSGQ